MFHTIYLFIYCLFFNISSLYPDIHLFPRFFFLTEWFIALEYVISIFASFFKSLQVKNSFFGSHSCW